MNVAWRERVSSMLHIKLEEVELRGDILTAKVIRPTKSLLSLLQEAVQTSLHLCSFLSDVCFWSPK